MSIKLLKIVREKFNECQKAGHLIYFTSELIRCYDGPLAYEIRYCPSLLNKNTHNVTKSEPDKKRNPFLPPDPSLVIQQSSKDYSLILNKFAIMKDHFMIITNEFVLQELLLEESDFDQMLKVTMSLRSDCIPLLFYNSGPESGASQSHRHVQIIPFDAPGDIPLYEHISIKNTNTTTKSMQFYFDHYIYPLNIDQPHALASLVKAYFDIISIIREKYGQQVSYNLLLTPEYMMMIPRKCESYGSISFNSLAFAGLFLTTNEHDTDLLKKTSLKDVFNTIAYPL